MAPNNAELHQMKGRLMLGAGDLTAARTSLERARALDPQNPLVRVDLATLYRNQGQLEAALREAEEAARLAPDAAEPQVARGLALGAQGREDAAAEAFRAALRASPDDPDALFFLGSVELRSGRPEAAKPLLERLLTKAPRYPGAQDVLDAAQAQLAPPTEGALRVRLLRVGERARAEEAVRRAAGGEDFATLARAFSEDPSASRGGDLGVVRLADLAEPLRSVAAALRPGEVSPVVEVSGGFVVLKRER
jgi:parvulin-like peptidyl-prolyl isomerase